MTDVLDPLIAQVHKKSTEARSAKPIAVTAPATEHLTQDRFWQRMASFLRPGDVIAAENGTALSGVSAMPLPSGATVISQALWGAIGYTLPATFGSLLAAPERRTHPIHRRWIFSTDGTGALVHPSSSSQANYLLAQQRWIHNRTADTRRNFFVQRCQPWKYASLCDVFSGGEDHDSLRVTSTEDLDAALSTCADPQKCYFIEVKFDRMDAPRR